MPTVFLYLGEATYRGQSEFSWQSPAVGDRHKLMLFLSQNENAANEAEANRELSRFGFAEMQLVPGKPISVDALNSPDMRAFHRHYDEALAAGSSVVWYPTILPRDR
jgi:hypothetical protein